MIATYLSDDNDHIIEESDEDDDMDKKPNSNYKVFTLFKLIYPL